MANESLVRYYRRFYGRLLRLYPAPYRERYGEGMAQTFNDVMRDCAVGDQAGSALHMLFDTAAGIIRENVSYALKQTRETVMQNRNIVYIALATAFILAIPLAAMQFTAEVQWTALDFAVVAVLLFGTGVAFELTAQRLRDTRRRITLGIGVLGALLVAWGCLAVGHEHGNAYLFYLGAYAALMCTAIISGIMPRAAGRI